MILLGDFNVDSHPLSTHPMYSHLCSLTDCLCLIQVVSNNTHVGANIDPTNFSGPDQISAKMLRARASSITLAVTQPFNISIKTGELPTDWKITLVTPIPKGGDKSHPNNYQPIPFCPYLASYLRSTFTVT